MRVLVTGSSGQLGSAVAALLEQQHEVTGLDVIPDPRTRLLGSVEDRDLIFSALRGMNAVIHTASLHARHLNTHTRSQFVSTNVQGTLNLLEASVEHSVRRFVYTSTTSLYGHAMETPGRAAWVTEALVPRPRDIYDVTKIAAENLCAIFAEQYGLPAISLRVSRFFPEPDRLTAIYRAYRGVDPRDAAAAHLLALHSGLPGFEAFNISARSPFSEDETEELYRDAAAVLRRHFPQVDAVFSRRGWALPECIDRVYVIEKAYSLLGYIPSYNFEDSLVESS